MNPAARFLDLHSRSGDWTHVPVFVAAPIIGALAAVTLTAALYSERNADEVDAAGGSDRRRLADPASPPEAPRRTGQR